MKQQDLTSLGVGLLIAFYLLAATGAAAFVGLLIGIAIKVMRMVLA